MVTARCRTARALDRPPWLGSFVSKTRRKTDGGTFAADGQNDRAKVISIPVSQEIVRDLPLPLQMRDPSILPSRANLIVASALEGKADPNFVLTAEMKVSSDGGSLRLMSGASGHETGWFPSWKRKRLQHWEGMTQLYTLLKAECDHDVLWAQSEARRFCFMLDGRWREYTCDVEIMMADGTRRIIENKADERSLRDPDYRLTLAGVHEICRRVGFQFEVVMADEVFVDRHHRDNIELFAGRAFTTVTPKHLRTIDAFAAKEGDVTTYGAMAALLEPDFPPLGKAVMQALCVRRKLEIDLTGHLSDRTLVKIH